jgi:hypothetical protein
MLGLTRTVIDHATPSRVKVSISAWFQNPASRRTANALVAPALRTRAVSSSAKRFAPAGRSPCAAGACST